MAKTTSVGRQIPKIQVLPRYLTCQDRSGTYLTFFKNLGTYLANFTQVLRYLSNLPPRISSRDLIDGGTSAVAALIPGTTTVLKFPHSDEDKCKRCNGEVEVYEHLKSFTTSRHRRSKSEHGARTYNRRPKHSSQSG